MHRSRCHIALQGYSPVNTTVFSILRGPAAADSAIMRCLQQQLNSIPSLLGAAPWQARPMRCNCFKRSCVRVKASLSVSGGDGEADVPGIVEYVSNSRKQLWLAAIKPPMYSVGIVPVLVGAAAAYFQYGVVSWGQCFALVLGAICVIAWLNLSNDAFDATTGVDKDKHESVVNLTGNRTGVLVIAKLFLAAGIALLAGNISSAHDNRVLVMLGLAIVCGYIYQGPPFRFSYKGLGEPLCFLAFGPLATTAFYLAHSPAFAQPPVAEVTAGGAATTALGAFVASITPTVAVLSVLVGITTTVILFCSHWHQIQGDIKAGKMSPLVKLGTQKACQVLAAATAAPYIIALGAAAAGVLPVTVLACLAASLQPAKQLLDFAYKNHMVPADVAPLKRFGVKWHIAVGLSLAAGLVISAH